MTGRTRVAVVFGGRGGGHDLSRASAEAVLAHLDRERFDGVPIALTPDGAWLPGDGSAPTDPVRAGEVFAGVDVVFPVLHGSYGPEGVNAPVQGLLEMAGLPYVGAGVLATAVGMDAALTATLLAAEGVPAAPPEGSVGRDIAVAVLELPDGSVRSSVPVEVRSAEHLDVDDDLARRLRATALAAFRAVDGHGYACVGLLAGPDGTVAVTAVDTMPPLTAGSMFPQAWAATGLDWPALLTTLVETTLARDAGPR